MEWRGTCFHNTVGKFCNKKIISPHAATEVVQVGTAGKPRTLTKESLQKLQMHMVMHEFSIKEKNIPNTSEADTSMTLLKEKKYQLTKANIFKIQTE